MPQVVIFDFLSDPMGGLLTSAREFLQRVRQYDSESRIVVLELNQSISSHVGKANNIEWVTIEKTNRFLGWRRMLWQNLYLPGIIKKYRADTYFSLSHYLPWTLPENVTKIIGISNLAPFSQEAFDSEIKIKNKLRLILLKKSIINTSKRATAVIALSQTCKNELEANGIQAEKITVISNGVNNLPLPKYDDGMVVDGKYILCVSHFYRYKNYENLIKAYSLLSQNIKQQYKLVLIGRPYDVGYFESMRNLVRKLELENNVILISGLYEEKLANAYRKCSLFVFPSLIENSPITLLEAMAYGAPVIASDVPAMREFGGDAILFFNPHSAIDAAHKISYVLDAKSVAGQLSKKSVARAARYSWDEFTKKIAECYSK